MAAYEVSELLEGAEGKRFLILRVSDGVVVGRSDTREKAERSIWYRTKAEGAKNAKVEG
jgi:hypothetical protein